MNRKGFTLIEILVTVLIVAILAAVALVQYAHFLERTRVGEVQNLIGLAIYAQERFMMKKGHYTLAWTSLDAGPLNAYMDQKAEYISSDKHTFYTKGGGSAKPANGFAIEFEESPNRWFAVATRVGSNTYSYTLIRPFDKDETFCIPSDGNQHDERMCVDIMALDSPNEIPEDPRNTASQKFSL